MAKTDLSSKEQTWFSCFVSLLFLFSHLKVRKLLQFEICETVSKYALYENTFPSLYQR